MSQESVDIEVVFMNQEYAANAVVFISVCFLVGVLFRYFSQMKGDYYDDRDRVFSKVLGVLTTSLVSSLIYINSSLDKKVDDAWFPLSIFVFALIFLVISFKMAKNKEVNINELISSLGFTILISIFFLTNFESKNFAFPLAMLVIGLGMLIYGEISFMKLEKKLSKEEFGKELIKLRYICSGNNELEKELEQLNELEKENNYSGIESIENKILEKLK